MVDTQVSCIAGALLSCTANNILSQMADVLLCCMIDAVVSGGYFLTIFIL